MDNKMLAVSWREIDSCLSVGVITCHTTPRLLLPRRDARCTFNTDFHANQPSKDHSPLTFLPLPLPPLLSPLLRLLLWDSVVSGT